MVSDGISINPAENQRFNIFAASIADFFGFCRCDAAVEVVMVFLQTQFVIALIFGRVN